LIKISINSVAYLRCITATSFPPFEEGSLGNLVTLFAEARDLTEVSLAARSQPRVLAREASPSDPWESELPVRLSLPVLTRLRPEASPVICCPESTLDVLRRAQIQLQRGRVLQSRATLSQPGETAAECPVFTHIANGALLFRFL
jgi:hypothetical protein